jgi:hypothetical protein
VVFLAGALAAFVLPDAFAVSGLLCVTVFTGCETAVSAAFFEVAGFVTAVFVDGVDCVAVCFAGVLTDLALSDAFLESGLLCVTVAAGCEDTGAAAFVDDAGFNTLVFVDGAVCVKPCCVGVLTDLTLSVDFLGSGLFCVTVAAGFDTADIAGTVFGIEDTDLVSGFVAEYVSGTVTVGPVSLARLLGSGLFWLAGFFTATGVISPGNPEGFAL